MPLNYPIRQHLGARIYGSESGLGWGEGEVPVILNLEEKSKTILDKAEFTSGRLVGAVAHLIRVTDFSYLAYSLSRKGSSKNGMRIIKKKN